LETTVLEKLVKKPINIALLLLGFMAFGCKTGKTVVSKSGSGLDYKVQKLFEKSYFEANKQKVLNNNEKALELYLKSLEINPESHPAMYQVAKLHYQLDKYEDALYWAEKSVKTTNVFNHWYSGQLAQFYNKFGKYALSADVFAQMVANEPEVRHNYTESASQYFNAKEYDKAIKMLELMQKRFGVELESSSRLEYVYTKFGQKDKAVEVMEELAASDKNNIQYMGFLAETYLSAGLETKAIKTLNEVIALEPSTGKAYYALYTIYSQKGSKELAISNLKEAFKYYDLSLQQKLQAVSSYFSDINSSVAIKDEMFAFGDILVEKYPTNIEPYLFQADISGTAMDYLGARSHVRRALTIDKTDYKVWGKLISLNVRLGDDKQQVVDTEEALEMFPNITEIYIAKGYSHLNLEQFNDAIDITEQGLDVAIDKTDKTELMLCQASAYDQLNNYKKSEDLFEKILKISPYNSTVLNNYSFSLAERKENLDKADSLINLALKLEPSNPFFLDTKAWILYGMKDYDAALKLLDKCMEIDPKNPEYYILAKEIFLTLGNQTLANSMQLEIDELTKR